MQISKQELRQIINEEIDTAIEEGWLDRFKSRASGVGGAAKAAGGALGKRATSIGRAVIGKGNKPSPVAGAGKGAYGHGKKTKIIDLHKKKIEKLLLTLDQPLGDLLDDLKNDVNKLGLADSQGIQQILDLIEKHQIVLQQDEMRISELLGQLLQAVGAGEITQEE